MLRIPIERLLSRMEASMAAASSGETFLSDNFCAMLSILREDN